LQFFVWSSRSGVTTPSMASLPSRAFRGASFGRLFGEGNTAPSLANLPGRYFHVPAFSRFDATFGRVEKSSGFTLRRLLTGHGPSLTVLN